ncbi:hypothetical protein A3L12_05590 [Thermococcus sp. P6]|uniref:class III signal peptide-containing protein n=1 Tax=Thermococcus sp. P6 TaxID=122420 RepID=UPI000B59EACF|nr:class III signal peptide-containing protein [Thermococcus sp. P6]ASJ10808.1 hypothetical protein A3L12_05590 [Thermococcus sp. P6]
MGRNAQASLEYLFMITLAIIMILIFVWRFFDPRFGTIRKGGELQGSLEKNVSKGIESIGDR